MQQQSRRFRRTLHPASWVALLLTAALMASFAAPASATSWQSGADSDSAGIIQVAPESALLFAQANLDPASDQMVLAADLVNRAGLEFPLDEADGEGGVPAGATLGIVVTSIPDTGDIESAAMNLDPMSASESLDDGGFAIVATSQNPQEIFDSQLEDIQDNQEFDGGEIVESEYGGVTITTYEPSDDGYSEPASVAMVGDYTVFGVRAEDLHPIIDTFNGDVASLATNANYQAVADLLPAESIASGFLNGPGVLEALGEASPEALSLAGPGATAMINAWSGFSFSAEPQGFRIETRSIPAGDAFEPIEPIDGAFFDKVPSTAAFATSGTDIDRNGYVTLLALAFASEFVGEDLLATPVADADLQATQDEIFAEASAMLGFNPKTDFVDLLTGHFGITASVSGDIAFGTPTVDTLIVSNVSDPAAMQDTIVKIAFIAGAGLGDQSIITERDVNGSTVNVIDISSSGFSDKVEFGVVGDELVISVGSGLDDYVEGPAAPLSSDPSFTAVMEHLPASYSSLTYVNMPVVMELVVGATAAMDSGFDIEDADPACGEYATQEDAQAAYDEDQFGLFELDQDFDGEACEDYFGGTPEATPAVTENPYANVIGLATVTTQEDGVNGTTTFLLIGGE